MLITRFSANVLIVIECVHLFVQPSSALKLDVMFKDKTVEFCLVVFGSPNKVHQMFVAGEDQSFIGSEGHDLITGLVDLICCYYAYYVAFPVKKWKGACYSHKTFFCYQIKMYI